MFFFWFGISSHLSVFQVVCQVLCFAWPNSLFLSGNAEVCWENKTDRNLKPKNFPVRKTFRISYTLWMKSLGPVIKCYYGLFAVFWCKTVQAGNETQSGLKGQILTRADCVKIKSSETLKCRLEGSGSEFSVFVIESCQISFDLVEEEEQGFLADLLKPNFVCLDLNVSTLIR